MSILNKIFSGEKSKANTRQSNWDTLTDVPFKNRQEQQYSLSEQIGNEESPTHNIRQQNKLIKAILQGTC